MASILYTFNTTTLSSGKVSSPAQTNLSLSANGVNIISLSAQVNGFAFNRRTPLTTQLSDVTVLGSVVRVDWAYHGDTFLAIIPSTGNLAFHFLSAAGATTVGASTAVSQFSSPTQQRKRLLGYF